MLFCIFNSLWRVRRIPSIFPPANDYKDEALYYILCIINKRYKKAAFTHPVMTSNVSAATHIKWMWQRLCDEKPEREVFITFKAGLPHVVSRYVYNTLFALITCPSLDKMITTKNTKWSSLRSSQSHVVIQLKVEPCNPDHVLPCHLSKSRLNNSGQQLNRSAWNLAQNSMWQSSLKLSHFLPEFCEAVDCGERHRHA